MLTQLQTARGPTGCKLAPHKGAIRLTADKADRKNSQRHFLVAVKATASPRQEERLERSPSTSQPTAISLPEEQSSASPPSWVSSPTFFLATLGGFLGITADLYAPWGQSLLVSALDRPTHAWVIDNIPSFVRETVCDDLISNVGITLGCAGWAFCTAFLVYNSIESVASGSTGLKSLASKGGNLQRLSLAWLAYVTAGGSFIPGDNVLIGVLKHTFARIRPSTGHHTFSFPSGHAAAATFTVGMVLFVLLPWCLERAEEKNRLDSPASEPAQIAAQGLQRISQGLVENGGKLWGVAVSSTILGRIFGDAHWVTDTLASACLSGALVSGFLILCQRIESADSNP